MQAQQERNKVYCMRGIRREIEKLAANLAFLLGLYVLGVVTGVLF